MVTLRCIRFRDEDIQLPSYGSELAAGLDLRASLDADITLQPGDRYLVPTNFGVEIPRDYSGFVVPRSGLANKFGLSIVNTPGIIDPDYRGEIYVNLINHGKEPITIHRGDRIAQLVIVHSPQAMLNLVDYNELSETGRGHFRHGSTGVN